MKKTVKAAALLAALVLAARLTACQGKRLVIENGIVTGYTPKVPANLVIPKGVTEIGEEAFWKCEGLTTVTIPDSVTKIGEEAFYLCKGLTSVTIPGSVTKIETSTFGSTGLTSVTIPGSVTSIEEQAFIYCKGLTSVTISEGVTKIGYRTSEGCTNLTSVDIPVSMTEIWKDAFEGCNKLEVTYAGTKAQWEKMGKNPHIGTFVVHCTDGDVNVK